jgi:ribonuclease HI
VTKEAAKLNDTDDDLFLNLPEYPDEDDTSKPSTSSKSPKRKDPRAIKYEPPEDTKEKVYKNFKFQEDSKGFVHVYTDGSCEGNGKYTAAAGLGVFYGDNHPMNVSDPVTGRPTNNAGEIQAAIRAIQDTQSCGIKRLNIHTDSQFLINSVCKWMASWKRKDWRLATGKKVVNEKDFRRLDELIETGNMLIKWSYVPAHSGHPGNEEADRLAKIGASLYRSKKDQDSDGDSF